MLHLLEALSSKFVPLWHFSFEQQVLVSDILARLQIYLISKTLHLRQMLRKAQLQNCE